MKFGYARVSKNEQSLDIQIEKLKKAGCDEIFAEKISGAKEFIALENNIDTTTSMGMLLFTMCAAFSEMERTLIAERVKAGLDAAHSKGRRGGRPRALTHEKSKKLESLVKTKGFSVTDICKIVGISRSVYYRALENT
jgi:DNA invertase Pin-like site-specific DNA recombinase